MRPASAPPVESECESLRQALRACEQKLAAVSDSFPIGVYHCDATGARTYTNSRWQEIFGLTAELSLGHAWLIAVHADDRPQVAQAWQTAIARGLAFDAEFRIVRPDGAVRIVRSRARPVVQGVPESGFVGALEDLTEYRENVRRLRASEAFLDRTGRLAGVGGWEVDLRSGEVTWSDKTRAIHEVGPDYQPSLRDGLTFYGEAAQAMVSEAIERALRHGTSWDLELPFVSAKGRELWVRTFGEVEYSDGIPARLIGAFQDVTESRARQKALEDEQALRLNSEEHARELDRLLSERSEMLNVMAHEVRQPLNNASAALQSAGAALRSIDESAASQRVTRAQVVLAQVMASIDNTLAVAALVARPDPIEPVDADIDTTLSVAIADLPSDGRRRIRIDRLTQTRTAFMDMSLMRLALRNLLSNALKYSPPDSEVVVCISDSDDPLALVIDVTNTGEGIPQELMPRLFSRGARGARPGMPSGHGLGLYIVRRVMEWHNGRVEVACNTPEGVTFRLWLDQSTE